MQVKKNTTTSYTPDMSEQENRESIIRMTEQIRSLGEKMDSFIVEVRKGFADIKIDSRSMEARYATKDEVLELKRSHQSLVRYLMGIVITIVSVVIVGVMALLGLKE